MFLIMMLKKELAGHTLSPKTFKKDRDGVAMTVAAEECTAAFMKCIERFDKCIQIGEKYVKKARK